MNSPLEADLLFMRQSLELAMLGQYTAHPNPRVGCVLVKQGEVIGTGTHWKRGGHHAEIQAMREAKDKVEGATCYVTLEPCVHEGHTPPCVNALISAGIKRIVIATADPNPLVAGKGIQALKEAGLEVIVGLLQDKARAINIGFFSRMIRRQPYVRAKVAMSLDGRSAMSSGESQWITEERSRDEVHLWRARSGAILTGSQTVLKDNCRLTIRDLNRLNLKDNDLFHQPLRVVIDSKRRISQDAAIFHQPGETVVMTRDNITLDGHHVDLKALLNWLSKREINDLMVEAGPTLTGALLSEGLVDELLIFIAPKLLGSDTKPFAALKKISQLSEHISGTFKEIRHLGKDLFLNVSLSDFAGKL